LSEDGISSDGKADGAAHSPLRRLRIDAGLSVRELAARTELSVSTINRIEHGEREIGARSRRRLAAALGCRESELYGTVPGPAAPFTELLDALAKLIKAGSYDIAADAADRLAALLRAEDHP